MLIPAYWAESKAQQFVDRKQITVCRFGWSQLSQADAQNKAAERLSEALKRILSGESLPRRERKHPYNGSVGVPIREEIVEQYGETIVTRNSYGARCLNSPNVLIADVDFITGHSCRLILLLVGLMQIFALAAMWWTSSVWVGVVLGVLAVPLGNLLAWAFHRSLLNSRGGVEEMACAPIREFMAQNSNWNARLYRTPLGIRMLVTHQTFSANDNVVAECFKKISADPIYAKMCQRQDCFRARVSPKPWRIGIADRMRGGVWPVAENSMSERRAWIDRYERASHSHSACAFLETLGSGTIHPDVRPVIELHDRLCRSDAQLPIA